MKILVFAPVGRDAELLCALLHKHRLGCSSVLDVDACVRLLAEGCDTLFITEEVIRNAAVFDRVLAEIAKEPEWSDLPVIALVSLNAIRKLGPHYEEKLQGINLTFIERPVRSEIIIQALSSAFRARRRQYQVRDFLTEKLREQENLWRTQKLESIGVLAGGIAHDFNNLLTGIMGSASLLQEVSDPEHHMLADQIVKAAERAANLTRQMLAYSGRGRFVVEHVNLTHLIRETLDLIKLATDKQISVLLDLDDHLPPVDADAGQMQQVFMNLIINASEAMESEVGTITVSTKQVEIDDKLAKSITAQDIHPGHYIRIDVQDTGCGMAEETISKIFDPFFTTKFTGRGLGLAAVSGIIRGHKGALQVFSKLGEGTTFEVFLPIACSEIESSKVVPSAKQQKGWGTILLVDDEQFVRRTGQLALEKLEYRVLLAENGSQALEMFHQHRDQIRLVVLDLTMPVMSGEETLRKLRAVSPQLPVLLSSGYNSQEVNRRMTAYSITGTLQKPYTAVRLAEAVNQAFSKATAYPVSPAGDIIGL